jgi:tRNA nucleotidyltransferase (CCA-adding enzyme)
LDLLYQIGKVATINGVSVYIVGGTVRDVLLGRVPKDVDVVVEGDGIKFSHILASLLGGKVVSVSRFLTSKVQIQGNFIDVASTRRESYSKPGSLPIVQLGTLEEDLLRRDFSINAMALKINIWGDEQIIDPVGGVEDLKGLQIRVLSGSSFQDDATRIMRAIKYEQRLGMVLERGTESQLKANLAMFDTLAKYRLRKELKLWFAESQCSNILVRASDLGAIDALDGSINKCIVFIREERFIGCPNVDAENFWVSFMAYFMDYDECMSFITRFAFESNLSKTIIDTIRLKCLLNTLKYTNQNLSDIHQDMSHYDDVVFNVSKLVNRCEVGDE